MEKGIVKFEKKLRKNPLDLRIWMENPLKLRNRIKNVLNLKKID